MAKVNKQMACLQELLDGADPEQVKGRYSNSTFNRATKVYSKILEHQRSPDIKALAVRQETENLSELASSIKQVIPDGELSDGAVRWLAGGIALGLRSVSIAGESLVRVASIGQTSQVESTLALANLVRSMAQPATDTQLAGAINNLNANLSNMSKPSGPEQMMWQMVMPFVQQTLGGMMRVFGGVPAGQPQFQQQGQPQGQPMAAGGFQQLTDDEEREVFGK